MYFTVLHAVTLISSTQQSPSNQISTIALLASLLNVSAPPPLPPDSSNITHQHHVQPPFGRRCYNLLVGHRPPFRSILRKPQRSDGINKKLAYPQITTSNNLRSNLVGTF
ncbi:hypothetical protein Lser_V15G09678 [Lactuca serriola]